ncbi:homoserine kinase [Denitromonas sp.]|uniref:homoserine kinase n=1 Tax=Denitromonas sp. TaxID=2734609 RepID=UPI002AFF3A9D|nr:homoserine kinase [Denitromonas sp.]
MSVFTPVTPDALDQWLSNYAIGHLIELRGISEGVQNSNFFVTTSLGRYVLTLFETLSHAELPFYLHLMAHLARHGLPVPAPIADLDNDYLGTLSGKPAALVRRLSGASDMAPSAERCRKVGTMMAGLHLAGQRFGRRQENPRGPEWRSRTAQAVRPYLPIDEQALLDDELAFQAGIDIAALPDGAIHADLFRDNLLWDGDEVGGVIDFYFAGNDALLFDLAVTVNDWCANADGNLDPVRTRALLAGYHAERPLTEAEHAVWPAMLRAAALRFWLSRAEDFHLPRDGEMVLIKDPNEYRDILRQRIAAGHTLPWLDQ